MLCCVLSKCFDPSLSQPLRADSPSHQPPFSLPLLSCSFLAIEFALIVCRCRRFCCRCVSMQTFQAELETRLQLGETAEQRRLRERNRVEEADNDLTEDLFGGGGALGQGAGDGLSGLALKNMQVRGRPAAYFSANTRVARWVYLSIVCMCSVPRFFVNCTIAEFTDSLYSPGVSSLFVCSLCVLAWGWVGDLCLLPIVGGQSWLLFFRGVVAILSPRKLCRWGESRRRLSSGLFESCSNRGNIERWFRRRGTCLSHAPSRRQALRWPRGILYCKNPQIVCVPPNLFPSTWAPRNA